MPGTSENGKLVNVSRKQSWDKIYYKRSRPQLKCYIMQPSCLLRRICRSRLTVNYAASNNRWRHSLKIHPRGIPANTTNDFWKLNGPLEHEKYCELIVLKYLLGNKNQARFPHVSGETHNDRVLEILPRWLIAASFLGKITMKEVNERITLSGTLMRILVTNKLG